MDFTLPKSLAEFREEVFVFMDQEWPKERRWSDYGPKSWSEEKVFRRKLGAQGWIGLNWPRNGHTDPDGFWKSYLLNDAMAYCDGPGNGTATGIVAPTLILFGSERIKQQFLPQIEKGEIDFALGYSEPEAGSDLAGLQTKAERDGDEFVINGTKLWTTGAHRSEYCWLAARTDPAAPKHKGVSLFMVPMDAPGITVRPIMTMAGERTNMVFWDNVRVPAEYMVGEENRGWYHVATALDLERINSRSFLVGLVRAFFDTVAQLVGRHGTAADAQRLEQLAAKLETCQMLSLRAVSMVVAGTVPNYEASMIKFYLTELAQELGRFAEDVLGPRAVDLTHPFARRVDLTMRASFMPTFGGGSNELMRNIIATRGLGLPRG